MWQGFGGQSAGLSLQDDTRNCPHVGQSVPAAFQRDLLLGTSGQSSASGSASGTMYLR